MRHNLKSTGILLGIIFILGFAVNFLGWVMNPNPTTTLIGKLLQWDSLLLLAMITLFFASAFVAPLQWAQPIIFLLMTPVTLSTSHESFYALGAYVVGVLLLFRLGFFERRRVAKIVASVAYLYGWELYFGLRAGRNIYFSLTPIFFITSFLLILYLAYQEKIMVYLKEPKEKLSLAKRGLSAAERTYVLALVGGMGPKEIAAEYEVSDSTVRNTIARSYQKLGVHDRSGLAALSEKYEFVE